MRDAVTAFDPADPATWAAIALWHVTSADAADAIARDGMRPGSYWTCDDALADYYAGCVRDEGSEPVTLRTTLARIPLSARLADRPGLQEPITSVLGREDDLRARYDETLARTGSAWMASLVALRSLRCADRLPAAVLERLPASPSPRI
jgi:hypothetical protein